MNIFWYRRDLRINDNTALNIALKSGSKTQAIFIFDSKITNELELNDPRISFIYKQLDKINKKLNSFGSSLKIYCGDPIIIWQKIIVKSKIDAVYINHDYEPYAITRDDKVKKILKNKNIPFFSFKDQVIFEKNDIVKNDGNPYTVFTPYKNKWLEKFNLKSNITHKLQNTNKFEKSNHNFPSLKDLNFVESKIKVPDFNLSTIPDYEATRNIPHLDKTSKIGPHLRFGTISIRTIVREAQIKSETYLSELIWREFFMQILWHFPKVVTNNFKPKYNGIVWRNNKKDFKKWCLGETGFPIVDAGMRELNKTGFMHNRVRMITASFLCKHLLIDWRWGESYFAKKLLDYELSSNNGNWQWSAGTGCDASPYFRIFNPYEQTKKFDKNLTYINKWIHDLNEFSYPQPMIDHKFARERALTTYKNGLLNNL
ncbi:MAG: deoxyribodipyrimidine photolyase [Crocinitomicaceae bacterium]|nr:deoxyribodipyrimidine photolyase [Crocinitomicaceae bacterium]|tara:strand:+ start:24952 stop:26235 length:1284 start_codon:yes stop_codon:yes gene_type:complete